MHSSKLFSKLSHLLEDTESGLHIKSAYDFVYTDNLIYKCIQIGINGKVANWLHYFLQDRLFQITWQNTISDTSIFHKDLAQDSVLSPNPFCYFYKRFLFRLWSVMLFADDIFVYCSQ